MPPLKIITRPDSRLRKKSTQINPETITSREFKRLVKAMAKLMARSDGVGLAAPQIGQNIALAVINSKDGAFCLINPKIIKKSWARELGQEGCLSVPGIFGKVRRHKKITLIYLDREGKKIKLTAQGLMARVLQHEIDHLNGILFIDKATEIEKNPNTQISISNKITSPKS